MRLSLLILLTCACQGRRLSSSKKDARSRETSAEADDSNNEKSLVTLLTEMSFGSAFQAPQRMRMSKKFSRGDQAKTTARSAVGSAREQGSTIGSRVLRAQLVTMHFSTGEDVDDIAESSAVGVGNPEGTIHSSAMGLKDAQLDNSYDIWSPAYAQLLDNAMDWGPGDDDEDFENHTDPGSLSPYCHNCGHPRTETPSRPNFHAPCPGCGFTYGILPVWEDMEADAAKQLDEAETSAFGHEHWKVQAKKMQLIREKELDAMNATVDRSQEGPTSYYEDRGAATWKGRRGVTNEEISARKGPAWDPKRKSLLRRFVFSPIDNSNMQGLGWMPTHLKGYSMRSPGVSGGTQWNHKDAMNYPETQLDQLDRWSRTGYFGWPGDNGAWGHRNRLADEWTGEKPGFKIGIEGVHHYPRKLPDSVYWHNKLEDLRQVPSHTEMQEDWEEDPEEELLSEEPWGDRDHMHKDSRSWTEEEWDHRLNEHPVFSDSDGPLPKTYEEVRGLVEVIRRLAYPDFQAAPAGQIPKGSQMTMLKARKLWHRLRREKEVYMDVFMRGDNGFTFENDGHHIDAGVNILAGEGEQMTDFHMLWGCPTLLSAVKFLREIGMPEGWYPKVAANTLHFRTHGAASHGEMANIGPLGFKNYHTAKVSYKQKGHNAPHFIAAEDTHVKTLQREHDRKHGNDWWRAANIYNHTIPLHYMHSGNNPVRAGEAERARVRHPGDPIFQIDETRIKYHDWDDPYGSIYGHRHGHRAHGAGYAPDLHFNDGHLANRFLGRGDEEDLR